MATTTLNGNLLDNIDITGNLLDKIAVTANGNLLDKIAVTANGNVLDKIGVTANGNLLDKIGVHAHIDPLTIDAKQTFTIPEPIETKSENSISVDLKPIVLDLCSTNGIKLPQGEISQPFHLHFGLTWFGMEVFGYTLGGETRTVLQDLPKKPAVDWPAQQNAPPRVIDAEPGHERPGAAGGRGLRVRIK